MTKAIQRFSLCIVFIITTILFTSIQSLASENIIVNGDALNGLQGWKTIDKHWKTSKHYGNISSKDLPFFYPEGFKDKDGAKTYIYQDVNIKNYAGKKISLSANICGWDNIDSDEKILLLQLFDTSNKILFSQSSTSTNKTSWHEKIVTTTIPNNAVRARVSLIAVYHHGSEVDAYFKNVKLVIGQYSATPSTPPATNPPSKTYPAASNPPAKPLNTQQNNPPAKPSNTQSTSTDNDTMMVLYLKKGDIVWLGSWVDGMHFYTAGTSISDRNVIEFRGELPPGWKKGYRPGFGIKALSQGESVIRVRAESAKTHEESVLKLRVIVED